MTRRRHNAFSLIEVMVSMTLLALIVTGLLVVFNHTSRALRAAHNTTDVFEGARAVVNTVTRDFSVIAAGGRDIDVNFAAVTVTNLSFNNPITSTQETVLVQDVFFITRRNDEWTAEGYFVEDRGYGVGTLYRFTAQTNGPYPDARWFNYFVGNAGRTPGLTNVHRISDGVIHFHVEAFDARGRPYPIDDPTTTEHGVTYVGPFPYYRMMFASNALPAFVEVQIGIMEPEALRKFNAISASVGNNQAPAQAFLSQQIGKLHMFRQRVPIRNHAEPAFFDQP